MSGSSATRRHVREPCGLVVDVPRSLPSAVPDHKGRHPCRPRCNRQHTRDAPVRRWSPAQPTTSKNAIGTMGRRQTALPRWHAHHQRSRADTRLRKHWRGVTGLLGFPVPYGMRTGGELQHSQKAPGAKHRGPSHLPDFAGVPTERARTGAPRAPRRPRGWWPSPPASPGRTSGQRPGPWCRPRPRCSDPPWPATDWPPA